MYQNTNINVSVIITSTNTPHNALPTYSPICIPIHSPEHEPAGAVSPFIQDKENREDVTH